MLLQKFDVFFAVANCFCRNLIYLFKLIFFYFLKFIFDIKKILKDKKNIILIYF
jgi:hypothetical protein